ncbi:MAG TPA: dihydropteroate synthase [Candidatus Koribacter sp.]|jgi:dihydropteroate synthase
MRPIFQWNVGRRRIELGKRTLVMGVLNVTPDSFSDGGQFRSPEEAVQCGLRLLDEGADLLDIGGESTRLGVRVGSDASVSAGEELRRVLPVIERLKTARPDVLISVDTYKAEVAKAAIGAGAEIVNDVSGLSWDLQMAHAVGELGCGVVVMHTRGTPEDWRNLPLEPRIVQVVAQELRGSVQKAAAAGVHHDHIVIDPGFGFGKRLENNYPLLAKLEDLHSMGFPLMVGLSRKSFLGHTAGVRFHADLEPKERLHPSIAAAVVAVMKGAHIVRVHDVRPTVEALAIVDALIDNQTGVNPWFDAYS